VNIELFTYWRSSCSHRVRILLALKGVEYRAHFVNLLASEQRTEDFRKKNPLGHVPALVVDGEVFIESVAIGELIEELFPEPTLLPRGAQDRARVRALVEVINAGIQPLQNLIVIEKVQALAKEGASLDGGAPRDGDGGEQARKDWLTFFVGRGMDALERLMEHHAELGVDGPYAYGNALTLADACLVPQVAAARRFGIDLSRTPRVTAAADAAERDPRVASAAPARQPDAPAPAAKP
jgi:maleylacetoacetate isomerase